MRLFLTALAAAVAASPLAPCPSAAQSWSGEDETAIARSAAPEVVSASASIWHLGDAGYEKMIEGSNGFNCLVLRRFSVIFDVQRDLWNWDGMVAPICYDPVASDGPMQEQFLRAQLGLAGASHDEVKAAVFAAYSEGRLPVPVGPSFSYMYSSAQRLTPDMGHWRPHFMIYAPGYTNAMLGNNAIGGVDPVAFEAPGTFRAIIAIPVTGRDAHIDPRM